MANIGQMMAGGSKTGNSKRKADDFYSTPEECTIALMRAEDRFMPRTVWEPACGDGAISKILRSHDRKVISTDLRDRGYGEPNRDFRLQSELLAPAIVTNPPFILAAEFIDKSHQLGASYIAMLLKSTFWHAASRQSLFARYQPSRIYALTWRLDFEKLGAPTMECMWCVWDKAVNASFPEYRIMPRPSVYMASA